MLDLTASHLKLLPRNLLFIHHEHFPDLEAFDFIKVNNKFSCMAYRARAALPGHCFACSSRSNNEHMQLGIFTLENYSLLPPVRLLKSITASVSQLLLQFFLLSFSNFFSRIKQGCLILQKFCELTHPCLLSLLLCLAHQVTIGVATQLAELLDRGVPFLSCNQQHPQDF